MFKNKDGSTLILVITLVAILTILALSAFVISSTDKLQVIQQNDKMQSYYLAKSGAEAAADYIVERPTLDIDALVSADNYETKLDISSDDTIIVDIITSGNSIIIKSLGTVNKRYTTLSLTLEELAIDSALFTNKKMDVTGLKIVNGDLGSHDAIVGGVTLEDDKNGNVDGDIEPYLEIELFMKHFSLYHDLGVINPDGTSENLDLSAEDDLILTDGFPYHEAAQEILTGNTYKTIDFSSPADDMRFIEDPADTGDDILVICDVFELKGGMEIESGDRLIIYADTRVIIDNPRIISDTADQLYIYLGKGAVLEFQTPMDFKGHIIGPEAFVDIHAGVNITGSIIANEASVTAQPTITYEKPLDGSLINGYYKSDWEDITGEGLN